MKKITIKLLLVGTIANLISACGRSDSGGASVMSAPSSSSEEYSNGSGGSSVTPQQSANPISLYDIPSGVAIDCAYLNPTAIKALSTETITWLASIQATGITLHENYIAARQAGYTGAFGMGQHSAWLDADPSRKKPFNAAVSNIANYYVAGYGTFAQHHQIRRAAGYKGLFECGGDSCFAAGNCDNLGRAK